VVKYERVFAGDTAIGVKPSVALEPWLSLQNVTSAVKALSYGDSGAFAILAVHHGDGKLAIARIANKGGMIGEKTRVLLVERDVSSEVNGEIAFLRASQNGEMVLLADHSGKVTYFQASASKIAKRQEFFPCGGYGLAQMDFLFGGVSVVCSSVDGTQEQWSLYRTSEDAQRLFGRIKSFASVGEGPKTFAASQRNRMFLTGAGRELSLRYSTSGAQRWQGSMDIDPVAVVIDAKGKSFWVASSQGEVRNFTIHDPHPDAGARAFFAKVWYEGGDQAVHQWQSSGGSDDFETKFSLVPLIFGSLKGTTYAMLFSVPIALLAAIFSAAFLPLQAKRIIKPTLEIMSSLPSVVLGFLAGLWLAPLLSDRVPSVLLMVVLIPSFVLLFGYFWCRLPLVFRNRFEGGAEWLIVLPIIVLAGLIGWWGGPFLEDACFVFTDPHSGEKMADFGLWWRQVTGTSFQQRNSLVLGFIMCFAVIPVIFTIAEDALSNVPKNLTAAAFALGANRWQVVWSVMLPVAASGIFSALMIGLGRAVGETMIMVMATGNTPIMEWNLFSGMRTLSANLAVELPEAAVGSTHYRTLFLGAIVLFSMTFVLNTLAEILRQRLREKYKLV
jgi:phosphate transport system permease protein